MSTEVQPYNYPSSKYSEFEKKGHPGKFLRSITCSSGTTTFTGSNFGAGGLIIQNPATGTASLSLGGTIPLSTLASSSVNGAGIIELSLESIKIDSGGPVYVLVRNQLVR
jgi:hypothetical protein